MRETKGESNGSCTRPYIRFLCATLCMFLGHLSYFPLAGVFTSLNAEVGFVSFGTMWFTWCLTGIFVGPPLVSCMGPRFTAATALCCYLVFVIANYYQSWPTLVFGGAMEGFGGGLVWPALLTSATTSAEQVANTKKKPPEKYISIFNGVISLGYCAAALVGSAASSALLLPSQSSSWDQIAPLPSGEVNYTMPMANSTNVSYSGSCVNSSDPFVVPLWAYYSLVTVAFVSTLASIFMSFGLGNDGFPCASSNHFCHSTCYNKEIKCTKVIKRFISKHYRPIYLTLFRRKFILIMLLSFSSGMSMGYYFGTFSRHFVSECLNVGVVGLAVIVWGLGSCTFALITGKISVYTSRTFVAIVTALLHASMILFMLFWEREPSYVMVFLTSLGWGIVDGMWMTLPAIYVGVVAKPNEKSSAYGMVKALVGLGGMTNFFMSGYIEVNVNLWILLSLFVVSVMLYIIGEKVFSSSKDCMCSESGVYHLSDIESKNSSEKNDTVNAMEDCKYAVGECEDDRVSINSLKVIEELQDCSAIEMAPCT